MKTILNCVTHIASNLKKNTHTRATSSVTALSGQITFLYKSQWQDHLNLFNKICIWGAWQERTVISEANIKEQSAFDAQMKQMSCLAEVLFFFCLLFQSNTHTNTLRISVINILVEEDKSRVLWDDKKCALIIIRRPSVCTGGFMRCNIIFMTFWLVIIRKSTAAACNTNNGTVIH